MEKKKKLSKQVENTVGKGEIALYEQFLLFPQCFQKACFPGASKGVIVWEWVNVEKILQNKGLNVRMFNEYGLLCRINSLVERKEYPQWYFAPKGLSY